MVGIHFIKVIVSGHHHCRVTVFVYYTKYFPVLYPLYKLVPVLLKLFYREYFHQFLVVDLFIGDDPIEKTGFEPAATRSQSESSTKLSYFSWRKIRDSNPGRCYPYWFSRPTRSTTLPIFLISKPPTQSTDLEHRRTEELFLYKH